jgi:hypothetical protein
MYKKRRRYNATGREKNGEQFFPISYLMAHSAAFRSLSGPALKVWIELRTRYNGGNNGHLSLSLEEAARLLGVGKATAHRAFLELQNKGFIVMTQRGQYRGRRATTWRVTDRDFNGQQPTHDWKRWQPLKGPPDLSVSVP